MAIDEDNHEWSDWQVVTAAKCNAEGVEKRTCECGNVAEETRAISKTVHVFKNGICTGCGADERITWLEVGASDIAFEDGLWTVTTSGGSQNVVLKAAAVNSYLDAGATTLSVKLASEGATFELTELAPKAYWKNSIMGNITISEANRDQDLTVKAYFNDGNKNGAYTVAVTTQKAFSVEDPSTWLLGANNNAGATLVDSYANEVYTLTGEETNSSTGGDFAFFLKADLIATWLEQGATDVNIVLGSKSGQSASFSSSVSGTLVAGNVTLATTAALTEAMATEGLKVGLYYRAYAADTTVDGFTVKVSPVIPASYANKASWIEGNVAGDGTAVVEYVDGVWSLTAERNDKTALKGNFSWTLDANVVNAMIEKGVTSLTVSIGAKEGEGFKSVWTNQSAGTKLYSYYKELNTLTLAQDTAITVLFYMMPLSESESTAAGFETTAPFTGYTIGIQENYTPSYDNKATWLSSSAMLFTYENNAWTSSFASSSGTRAFTLEKDVVNAMLAKGVTSVTITIGAKEGETIISTYNSGGAALTGTATETKTHTLTADTALSISFYTRADGTKPYTGYVVTITENTEA